MEQFRQIGEVLGSLKALLVFQDNIMINRRQCLLLFDLFNAAFDSISEEMSNSLRFEEKSTIKWRILEQPLKDLCGVFREGEAYVKHCLEPKELLAKAVSLHRNRDCVEFHVHNLLSCVPIVVEAIIAVGEISGSDQEVMRKKRSTNACKYKKEFQDWRVFRWKFGKEYLVCHEFCERFNSVLREDWWDFFNRVKERKISGSTKNEQQLIDQLFKSFNGSESGFSGKLLPSSILFGSKDYQVRRRLGFGSQCKEVLWLGQGFALRHFFGDFEPLFPEISLLLSLSHPNIVNFLCGFTDEEKKEWFLIMELMSKDLSSYIKEICGPRKRIPFSLPVAIDLMLQIARGMEYLHSNRIYHGDLNPSNILVKSRGNSNSTISAEGNYLQAKVSGFGFRAVRNFTPKSASPSSEQIPSIWHAPEVLEEEQSGTAESLKCTEKSDVYSFGMVCFEVLTGKVPFEDSHLQGDKMRRNIRAGERPLFPFQAPKYVTNLTKKCWHTEPNQRPSFSSICRVLRYIKWFIAMNPDCNNQQDPPMPTIDYSDIELGLMRNFPSWSDQSLCVSQIPFQMFVYRVSEREKMSSRLKENSDESGSDAASNCGDENVIIIDDVFPSTSEKKSLASPDVMSKKPSMSNKFDTKVTKMGTSKWKSVRPPQINPIGRTRRNSESQLTLFSPRLLRTSSGHASDSELP